MMSGHGKSLPQTDPAFPLAPAGAKITRLSRSHPPGQVFLRGVKRLFPHAPSCPPGRHMAVRRQLNCSHYFWACSAKTRLAGLFFSNYPPIDLSVQSCLPFPCQECSS